MISIKMATRTGDRQAPVWAWIGFVLSCCFFSGIIGDVPDGVVYTDLRKTVQVRDRVVLKCQFLGAPLAVYWKKGNDPTVKQSLMSWFGDEPLTGTCTKDKTCEMGDDFSLIIKNISIADQNRYICRVANYKGILIYNFTDVKVFDLPEEPYPIINECRADLRQKCALLATSPINITCTALKYFPNVDLFFLHGDQKYKTIDTLEWTHTDGTKSKSIFTTVPPSEKPYVCVAFNIPGSQEQRTATVTVTGQTDVTTSPSMPSATLSLPSETDGPMEHNKYSVIKIVMPILAVFCLRVGIILFFAIFRKRQRGRENKNDEESMAMIPRMKIKGNISYYELWRLFRELDDTALLRNTLRELRKADIKEDLSEQEGYEMLYTWKDNTRSGNEGKILKAALLKALEKEDYDRARNIFSANRNDSSMKIHRHILEHILWNINDLQKIEKFLRELIPGRPTSVFEDSVKILDAVQSAFKELTEWNNGQLEWNPLVLLSFALERAECRSVAREFFLQKCKGPEQLTSPIGPKAIEEIVQKLTGRHCNRLMAGKISSDDRLGSIIAENNDFLFDTKTMISDWLHNLEWDDYEKRCRFDDAVIKIGRYDLLNCFGTISHRPFAASMKEQLHSQRHLYDYETIYDDEIPQLVKLIKCLSPDKIAQFNEETGLSADKDANILEDKLRERRDDILTKSTSRKASLHEFRSLRHELVKHTKNINSTVTDEEIEAVASQVTAADKQQELLGCLGIEVGAQEKRSFVDQLKEWRKTQANRHNESLRQIRFDDSTLTDEEIEDVASKVTSTDKQQEMLRSLDIELSDQQNRPFVDQLKEWRTKETQGNCREALYLSLRDMGFFDSTVTDEEIEEVASQVTGADKQQELLGCLGIEVGAQEKRSFVDQLKEWRNTQMETNCHKVFYQSLKKIGFSDFTLTDDDPAQVTSIDKMLAQSRKLKIRLGKFGRSLLNHGNKFIGFLRPDEKTNCRKILQESLRVIGLPECIVSKSTKKFVYQVELSGIALNLLMEDVRPLIEALAIDRSTVNSCIQPVSKQNKGTKRLVLELLRSGETTRDNFCKTLRCSGFVDVSRSVYFDYEPSLSELINIVDRVGKGHLDCFLEHLDLDAECRDSKGQIDKLKLMRVWKHQIQTVPYHYRLEMATALRDAGLNGVANSVLSGEYRQKIPRPDVIKDMCCRLDDVMRNDLCKWLKEISGLKDKASTALVINWVNRWMREYCPTGILSLPLPGHMEERKGMNDILFNRGIPELAEEISALENSHLQ